jgi:predicted ester cyclase
MTRESNGEQMVADADHLVIAYTMTNTHQSTFLGFAPTGKQVRARGVQIGTFSHSQLIERWGSSDQLGILQQLGLIPSPSA